jgi:hypothetical protein
MDKDEAKAAKRAAKEAKKRAAAEEQPEEEPPAKEKKSKKARRESEGGDDGPAAAPPAHKQDAAETGIGSGRIKDLWKNGEAAWRDGTLDSDYLVRNPDGITRLFCGNLKLDVTEEALRGHITGITFIKWQKDKVTKEFYGSTFLEMKDPKAAAVAVYAGACHPHHRHRRAARHRARRAAQREAGGAHRRRSGGDVHRERRGRERGRRGRNVGREGVPCSTRTSRVERARGVARHPGSTPTKLFRACVSRRVVCALRPAGARAVCRESELDEHARRFQGCSAH